MNNAKIGFSPEGKFKRKLTEKIHNGLKCYEIVDGEITAISFVKTPANGVMAKIVSEEDMTIAGVILLTDKMIYRINPITGEEYYIFFTKEVINKMFNDYRNKHWSATELEKLFYSYTSGKSIEEISLDIDRTPDDIENSLNDGDRVPLEILRMSNMKLSTQEMADKLGVDLKKMHEIIGEIGGTLVPREN